MAKKRQARRCKGQAKHGPCGAYAMIGSQYCRKHQKGRKTTDGIGSELLKNQPRIAEAAERLAKLADNDRLDDLIHTFEASIIELEEHRHDTDPGVPKCRCGARLVCKGTRDRPPCEHQICSGCQKHKHLDTRLKALARAVGLHAEKARTLRDQADAVASKVAFVLVTQVLHLLKKVVSPQQLYQIGGDLQKLPIVTDTLAKDVKFKSPSPVVQKQIEEKREARKTND